MSLIDYSSKRFVSGRSLLRRSFKESDAIHPWKTVLKVFLLTSCALAAFAANSVLCRFALGTGAIDAAGFTFIRLLSGVVALFLVLLIRTSSSPMNGKGSWPAGLMLFLYAVTFSYAYLELETGSGALILFGSVQITIIGVSIVRGNNLLPVEWVGLALAFAGLVYLFLPGVSAPSIQGLLLMSTAGAAWGMYTLLGRGSDNPLADTAYNFLRSMPLILVIVIFAFGNFQFTANGTILAIVSGALTSGLGYTIWYIALKDITATQAAVSQLAVPVIAALGGVIFMSEVISLRLTVAAFMILGGIFMVVIGRVIFIEKETSIP
ncbi:MAG: DMT family transporter [Desulfofustis sp.]